MADDHARSLDRPAPLNGAAAAAGEPGAALRAGRAFARTMIRLGRRIWGLRTVPRRSGAALRYATATATRAVWSETDQRWRGELDRAAMAGTVARSLTAPLTRTRPVTYRVRQRRPTIAGSRPRVLHAIPNVYLGGSTQLIVDLHDHLGHKYEMAVVTSAVPRGSPHAGMVVHHVPQTSTEPELQARRLVEVMEAFRPDLVHVHFWGETDTPWYADVFAAAGGRNCRILQNVNTPVVPFDHPGTDLTVFVSEYVRRTFGRPGAPSRVIYPGIDLSAFSPPDHPDPRSFDSIGMVYRLEPDKLDRDAIEPLILAVKRRPRTRAFVIGAGSLFERFVARTVEEGVRGNFDFPGEVPYADLPGYYASFRVFVAPVARESFGQVVPFAMNMGLAVAGNRIGALPEILEGDETLGRSPDETAERIVALLDDPSRMGMLGLKNRAIAQAKFGIDGMIRAYDEVYGELLAEGSGAGSARTAALPP